MSEPLTADDIAELRTKIERRPWNATSYVEESDWPCDRGTMLALLAAAEENARLRELLNVVCDAPLRLEVAQQRIAALEAERDAALAAVEMVRRQD